MWRGDRKEKRRKGEERGLPNSDEPIKFTLCWTDPAGNLPSSTIDDPTPALINDLDLRVIHNGDTFYPWKLDVSNLSAPATNGDNLVDNVEQIEIQNPSGFYQVVISHKGTLMNGIQDYSLIISNAALAPFKFIENENNTYSFSMNLNGAKAALEIIKE